MMRTRGWLACDAGELSQVVWAGVSMTVSCRCTHAVVMEVRASNLSNATTQPRSVLHCCFCPDAVQSPLTHRSLLRLPAFTLTHSVTPWHVKVTTFERNPRERNDRSCATSPCSTRLLLDRHCLEVERPYIDFKMERQQTFQRVCIFDIIAGPAKLGIAQATMHSSPARHCCSGSKTRVQKGARDGAHSPA
jgi:hypothetical protein